VRGLNHADGTRIITERMRAPFASLADFQLRTALAKPALRALAKIGALNGLAEHRRAAQWQVETVRESDDLFASVENSPAVPLRAMSPIERVNADYAGTSLTTGPHPMALLRAKVPHLWRAADLEQARHGERVVIGGAVICRQRPGTAKGFVFVSVEDETGVANAIVTPQLYEQCRLVLGEESFLAIEGKVQRADRVIHVKAERVTPLAFGDLPAAASHDFH
jgi:error-prone DNA polymerase